MLEKLANGNMKYTGDFYNCEERELSLRTLNVESLRNAISDTNFQNKIYSKTVFVFYIISDLAEIRPIPLHIFDIAGVITEIKMRNSVLFGSMEVIPKIPKGKLTLDFIQHGFPFHLFPYGTGKLDGNEYSNLSISGFEIRFHSLIRYNRINE